MRVGLADRPRPGVFVCGDAHRGASLIVWAIAEGRSAAHAVDAYLMGESDLPAPVMPTCCAARRRVTDTESDYAQKS